MKSKEQVKLLLKIHLMPMTVTKLTCSDLLFDCGSVSQLFNSSLSEELPPFNSFKLRLGGIFKQNVPSISDNSCAS